MAPEDINLTEGVSTEQKIMNAARKVFHQKGFEGTRTRDIANEAGINLALLNYYFRSKEKLFQLIMLETLTGFLGSIKEVFNNETTTLQTKIESIVSNYIDLLIIHPDIPMFLLNEIKRNPAELMSKINVKEVLMNSCFIRQIREGIEAGHIASVNPLHLIMNIISMTIFPFVASPMLKALNGMSNQDFTALMEQRKSLIPLWISSMLKAK